MDELLADPRKEPDHLSRRLDGPDHKNGFDHGCSCRAVGRRSLPDWHLKGASNGPARGGWCSWQRSAILGGWVEFREAFEQQLDGRESAPGVGARRELVRKLSRLTCLPGRTADGAHLPR